jgi:D-alanyl-D-alanine dipeptidase
VPTRFGHRFARTLIAFLLVSCLALNLVACNEQTDNTATDKTSQPTSFVTTATLSTVRNETTAESTPLTIATIATTKPQPSETTETVDMRQPSRQLKVRVISAAVYQKPDPSKPIITFIPWLTVVGYIAGPDSKGFSLIQTAAGQRGYCLQNQLVEVKALLYAQVPDMKVLSVIPDYVGPEKTSQLIDVRQADPSICIDLIFASNRNFTGKQIYERDICLLQQGTMKKLKQAQALFRKDGYSIKIYDAYRPYSVTVKIAPYVTNSMYLADPLTGSIHNRGAAVDMTVVNAKGIELEMPSSMHTLDARASRTNLNMTPEARRNLDYVESIMTQSGFVPYVHEWWHYSDASSNQYPHLDLSLAYVEMVVAAKLPTVKPPPVLNPAKSGYVSVSPTPSPSPSPSSSVSTTSASTS